MTKPNETTASDSHRSPKDPVVPPTAQQVTAFKNIFNVALSTAQSNVEPPEHDPPDRSDLSKEKPRDSNHESRDKSAVVKRMEFSNDAEIAALLDHSSLRPVIKSLVIQVVQTINHVVTNPISSGQIFSIRFKDQSDQPIQITLNKTKTGTLVQLNVPPGLYQLLSAPHTFNELKKRLKEKELLVDIELAITDPNEAVG